MRRVLGSGVLGLLLFASACSTGVSGPQTYNVAADAPSAAGKNYQHSAFFPSTLKLSPGDTVVFENKSSQAPHTISFGIDERRANQPPVVLPTGDLNPVVLQACASTDLPRNDLVKCPNKKLPAFDGEGYWNSGFLVPAPAPADAGPKKVTLELADDIPAGQYRYLCILHGPMVGILQVLDEEGDRESKEDVVKVADDQVEGVLDAASEIEDPKTGLEGDTFKAAAGWGNNVTSVNRFFPATIEVKAGQTVSWENFSSYEPHTVSFGRYKDASEEGFAPEGIKSGSAYTGGDSNSGIFGAKGGPYPPGPFTLSFPKAGEYSYVCTLHGGMVGKVKVT